MYFVCTGGRGSLRAMAHVWGPEKLPELVLAPSIVWVSGMELRLSGRAASTFTRSAFSPANLRHFLSGTENGWSVLKADYVFT